jgi:hypothetical protein
MRVPLGREKKEREEPDWEITARVPDILAEGRIDVIELLVVVLGYQDKSADTPVACDVEI